MKALKDFGCKSNPFDVLTQTALEYARAIVFANSRLGNDELPEGFTEFDSEHFQFYVDRMDKCVEILSSIPKEELEICRRNSLMIIDNKQMQVNDMLCTLFNEFDTEYSRSVPFLSEEMERVLYGVDSDTYKRHEFLRGFYEQHKDDDILTSDNLHSYLDFVCNDMDYCKKYFQWSDEKCKLVKDLNNLCELSQLDAEYLLSMVKKAKKFVVYNKVTEKMLNIHGDWVDDLGAAHLFTKVSAESMVNYIGHQAKRYPDISVEDLVVLPVHLKIKKGDLSLC